MRKLVRMLMRTSWMRPMCVFGGIRHSRLEGFGFQVTTAMVDVARKELL